MHWNFRRELPWVFAGLALCCAIANGGTAEGTTATNLGVAAMVESFCLVSTSASPFGEYDPIGPEASNDKMLIETVRVACVLGSNAMITLDQGANPAESSTDATPLRRMTDGASHYLGYFLYQDASHRTVWGNSAPTSKPYRGSGMATELTVYGVAPHGQNIPTGVYGDSVVATVSY